MRKIFIVVAGGNAAAERHFEDTIQSKRSVNEIRKFLPQSEIENLEGVYHGAPFIVWGAVPGRLNETRWMSMEPGDIALITNRGRIRFVGEIGAKVRSKDLANYFWRETPEGNTWELIYFILNEQPINIPLSKLNPLFGYAEHYFPRGLTMINEEAIRNFSAHYGDIVGVIKTLEKNEPLIEVKKAQEKVHEQATEEIWKAPTEHSEIQWRLIRLGAMAKFDIWVPRRDQAIEYEGHRFREYVLHDFHQSMDVPTSIMNIDVVWKFGPYSIKSAFEIEHTTSVSSGIGRLADLKVEAPNSNFPLFIVASETRRKKVFDELQRSHFRELHMDKAVRYLGYEKIREVDTIAQREGKFDPEIILADGEMVV